MVVIFGSLRKKYISARPLDAFDTRTIRKILRLFHNMPTPIGHHITSVDIRPVSGYPTQPLS